MPSYLDDTYLGEAVDDAATEVGAADNLPALRQQSAVTPGALVRLPGGITMPRRTAIILLAVVIAIVVYQLTRKKKVSP